MNTDPVLASLRNASSLLSVANNELCRPSEDTVTFCACQSTKKGVAAFLQSYLREKKVKKLFNNSLQNLLAECGKIDPEFKSIDISCFGCKTHDESCVESYCLDVKKVNECLERAKTIERFVLEKLNVKFI